MTEILTRLMKIARSRLPHFKQSPSATQGWYKEERTGTGPSSPGSESSDPAGGHGSGPRSGHAFSKETGKESHAGVPAQVVEDLALFDLKPPSSLEEVRKARNREIKKYHSDKFLHDKEKLETSKEIMQIYNAAYERLEEYFIKKRS
ncbi:J domain-containing protein [Thermodesulfobacteriota bacterium]